VAAVVAVGGALAPLAIHQRGLEHTTFIAGISLRSRVIGVPKKLVTGELGTPTPLIGPLVGLITVAAIAYALYRWRTRAAALLALAAATFAIPLALALAGTDYLLDRNVIALYVPLVLLIAAGLGAAGRIGLVGAIAICAVALTVNLQVASDAKLQRDDWRGAAKALGPAGAAPRAIVVSPDFEKRSLRLYAGSLPPMPAQGATVREVDVIGRARPPSFPDPPPPGTPGVFSIAGRARTASYELIRYRAPVAVPVTPGALAASRLGHMPAAILIQLPERTHK
jgi:hypothetical protein